MAVIHLFAGILTGTTYMYITYMYITYMYSATQLALCMYIITHRNPFDISAQFFSPPHIPAISALTLLKHCRLRYYLGGGQFSAQQ